MEIRWNPEKEILSRAALRYLCLYIERDANYHRLKQEELDDTDPRPAHKLDLLSEEQREQMFEKDWRTGEDSLRAEYTRHTISQKKYDAKHVADRVKLEEIENERRVFRKFVGMS